MDLGTTPWIWTMVLALLVYVSAWPLDRLPGGDSGELMAEACVGGVAHPPGYPLLLTLLRFAHWIVRSCFPVFGESIRFVYVANALNALLAAAAAACVSHTVDLLSKRRSGIEAVAAGLLFALSKLTWEYARGLEVFALNNLLVGILHILVVRHFMHATTRNACMGAFVCTYTSILCVRALSTCEGVRPDVTHLSLQLLPFPWFTRQHKLYPSVAFPRIRRDVSTTKSSEGYARFLHEFLAVNMAQHGDRLFLDLHAVNDHDIAPNGQYLGFSLSPHGLVWKVSPPPPTAADAGVLYSLWEATPSPPMFVAAVAFPPGSWEFAAAVIANDARYQGALYALSYWLDRARTIQHANEVATYVLGLHRIVELLTEVDAHASSSEAWGLTYEAYDLAKNAGLAAMRLQAGIELIAPRMAALMEQHRRSEGSQEARAKLQELMNLVERADAIRDQAWQRIDPLLVEMRARSDLDTQAFADFMATKAPTRNKAKKPKKKKRKRSH
ncbi:hypothetical protein BBJ28_00024631 [Nothophytophthora sp. Chile5]|nr:hypothetical protein BBJ28_00024631 [Nothophytophthora sp. Chile5]